MHMTAKLSADLLELTLPFLPHRLPKNRKLPLSRSSAYVCESEKVKGLRLSLPPSVTTLDRKAPKLNEASLFWVQFQTKPHKPLLQFP
jgi:hypothetical protein